MKNACVFARPKNSSDNTIYDYHLRLAIKAITDFALIHSADFGSNDMSSIPTNSEIPNDSGDASSSATERSTMLNKIADNVLKLSMNDDMMAAGEPVTPALQLEVRICQILPELGLVLELSTTTLCI